MEAEYRINEVLRWKKKRYREHRCTNGVSVTAGHTRDGLKKSIKSRKTFIEQTEELLSELEKKLGESDKDALVLKNQIYLARLETGRQYQNNPWLSMPVGRMPLPRKKLPCMVRSGNSLE